MFTNPGFTLGDQIFWMVDLSLQDHGGGGLQAADRTVLGRDLEPGEAVRAAVSGAVCRVEGGDAAEGAGGAGGDTSP